MTLSPLLIFQSLQRAQIQLFSLWRSHSHFPTHTHIPCASGSAPLQTACQSVYQIGLRNRSHTLICTHIVWIAVGNIWDGFPRNVLACLRNVSLLSSPHTPSFSLSFPTGRGQGKAGKRQHACFWTLWHRQGFFLKWNSNHNPFHFCNVPSQNFQ